MKKLVVIVLILIAILFAWTYIGDHVGGLLSRVNIPTTSAPQEVKVVSEESVTIDTVKNVGPSVVTIVETAPPVQSQGDLNIGPFSIFGLPGQTQQPTGPQSIGSGFVVNSDGTLVTNKHVVSDTNAKYQVITSDDKKYDVQKIYRDPLNDVAILKIDPTQNSGKILKPVAMGDSTNLQVGQFVIAIGTALGEFNNTVTTGVISGLGRGITAGDEFAGAAETLDNVIQTDAAINPGNSGGPLLNSSGQVIGVNTAIAQGGQNIGFALPINVIKDSLNNFNQNGQFKRPYLGVAYTVLDPQVAQLNNVPAGAQIESVVAGSPAQSSGIQNGDVIVKIDGKSITKDTDLSGEIASRKVGDSVTLQIWRSGQTLNITATLTSAPTQ